MICSIKTKSSNELFNRSQISRSRIDSVPNVISRQFAFNLVCDHGSIIGSGCGQVNLLEENSKKKYTRDCSKEGANNYS
jgi:hypothetical protein